MHINSYFSRSTSLAQRQLFPELRGSNPQLRAFSLGILFLGINNGILTSTFSNYLDASFHLDASHRALLEFPREAPGFALVFITAFMSALTLRAWGIIIGMCSTVGVVGMGWASPNLSMLVLWMVFWSLGEHLFLPVERAVGLALAKPGQEGRLLGHLSGTRNLAMIGGTIIVTILTAAGLTHFGVLYAIAGVSALCAARVFARADLPEAVAAPKRRFVFRWRYRLFYALNILFGARKQIFVTFAPWVLVTVYHTSASTMATLIMVAAIIGVFFRQYFGLFTDRYGERVMLVADSFLFVGICAGFAFSASLWLLYPLYILDNLMFATGIARATYLNRVTTDRRDLTSTLAMGISLDHGVSMLIPMIGGVIWMNYGYKWVFLSAALIAALNVIVASRLPGRPSRSRS